MDIQTCEGSTLGGLEINHATVRNQNNCSRLALIDVIAPRICEPPAPHPTNLRPALPPDTCATPLKTAPKTSLGR